MGLFSKLKSNMDGGVQVHVQAPSAVPSNQVIPVTVTITASSSRTINNVKAELKAQIREEGLRMGGMPGMGNSGIGVQAGGSNYRTVAQIENRESFTINPGETKTVNLQLYLSGNGGNNSGSPMGGALGALMNVAQGFEHVNYLYRVEASADVQDVHLSPSDKMAIEILPPAQASPAAQPTPFDGQMPQETQPIPNPAGMPPAQVPQPPVQPQDGSSQSPPQQS